MYLFNLWIANHILINKDIFYSITLRLTTGEKKTKTKKKLTTLCKLFGDLGILGELDKVV